MFLKLTISYGNIMLFPRYNGNYEGSIYDLYVLKAFRKVAVVPLLTKLYNFFTESCKN